MLHWFAFWKPHKCSRAELTTVSYELALKDIHAMAATMRVVRIGEAGWIPEHRYAHAGFRFIKQRPDIKWSPDLLQQHFAPFDIRGIHDLDFSGNHCFPLIMSFAMHAHC